MAQQQIKARRVKKVHVRSVTEDANFAVLELETAGGSQFYSFTWDDLDKVADAMKTQSGKKRLNGHDVKPVLSS